MILSNKRIELHALLGLFFVAILCGFPKRTMGKAPNVVVILADDQGWGDLGLHGNVDLSTPRIDSLAREGAEVDHFYVCAVCSPTRAEFLTGRYHSRMGVFGTSLGGERFHQEEQTIAEVFQQAGFATAAYGKWHSGTQFPYHPNARGFDDFYGFCSGHWGNYFSPLLEHNGRVVTGEGFLVDDFTTHAIDFISANQNRPFFLYLPLNTPHSPMQVPDDDWNKFKNKDITPDPEPANQKHQDWGHTRAALAMCENIDKNVGRLLDHLEKLQLAHNTIVVYFSDNGPNGARFNGGMRGRKGSTYEGGLRSPLLIRYPEKIQPGTRVTPIASVIDLLPTLTELAGVPMDSPKPVDGRSIAPLLRGEPVQWRERLLFSTWNGRSTVRSQHYRLHNHDSRDALELYDLGTDPRQHHDISKDHPRVVARLGEKLSQWIAEVHPQKTNAHGRSRLVTLGHPDAKYDHLPARDAVGHGGIERSNRFPNCTFFRNWKDTTSEISWDVDVLGEGSYEVQMYYACALKDVGASIELKIGNQTLTATIWEPNDSPWIGAPNDRVERIEGDVRRWKPMTLGTIQLRPGRSTVRLKATDIPQSQVCEMRMLVFRKLSLDLID